jgi:hypothetical protein
MLTTLLQLVPRSRIRGSIHPLPHTPSLVKHRDRCICTLFFITVQTPSVNRVGVTLQELIILSVRDSHKIIYKQEIV